MALLPSGKDIQKSLDKRRKAEPAKSYLWHVEMPDLRDTPQPADSPSMKNAKSIWEGNGDRNIDMELLNTLITDITTPYFNFETEKVTNGSTFWYEAKHNDITDLTLTIEEQESGDTEKSGAGSANAGIAYRYLKNWADLIANPDGTYNPPHFYKRNIRFYLLNMAKYEFQVFEYTNYFITEISSRSHSYENTEAITYDVSFTGDSLNQVVTVNGSKLDEVLENVSQALDVDIEYNRFDFSGVLKPAQVGILNETARRVL